MLSKLRYLMHSSLGIVLCLTCPTFADSDKNPSSTLPTTQTAPALQEFTCAEYRFRLKYPADWSVPERSSQKEVFSARTAHLDLTDTRTGTITLRIDKDLKGSSDAAILADLSDTVAGYIFKTGGQHVKIKPDQLGNLPARRITFQNDLSTESIEAVYIVAVKDRVEYVFNFAAPAALFDAQLPAVSELIKSFELLD